MATTIHLRNAKTIPSAYPQASYTDMTTVGSGASGSSTSQTTPTGPNERWFGGATDPLTGWSERLVQGANVTIAGSITFSYRCSVLTVGMTARFRARLYKVTAGGSNIETLIAEADGTVDLAQGVTNSFSVTPPSSVTVVPGERFLLRTYIIPVAGSYGTDGTASIQFGAGGVSICSVTFTETFTFQPNLTKLHLRRTNANGIGNFFDALEAIGSTGFTTGVVNTAAGGTAVQWTRTAGGTALEWISGRLKAPGFTAQAAANFTGFVTALESSLSANCGFRLKIFQRTPAGVETLVFTRDATVEFGTTAANWQLAGANGTSTLSQVTNFAEDDRLVARVYIIPVGGTMAGGFTCTVNYDHNVNGVSGDSAINLLDGPLFKAEGDPAGSSRVPSGQALTGIGN